MDKNGFDAVIPSGEKGLEPLHAVYRVSGCLQPVLRALKSGKRRVISWHEDANVHVVSPEETTFFAPQGLTFLNVNTLVEFRRAEEKAREHDVSRKN